MNAQPGFFLGYSTLEDFMKTHPAAQPVYVITVDETQRGHPADWVTAYRVVTDFRGEYIGYWRMRLGACDFVQGRPFNEDKWDKVVQRAKDADELIPRFLKRPYSVACEKAVFAMSKDVRLLEGTTHCLGVDEDTDRLVLRTEHPGARGL
jgi:hypothetical protein